ncbi:MAG: hypothetical protein ABI459_09470, partial [Deltaproteobacteria bacterium]
MWSDVDFYCERMAPGFGHEPFNAASAALFVIAGLVMVARLQGRVERATAFSFAVVGVGSLALHLSGTMIGYALDIGANFVFFTAVSVWLLTRLMTVRFSVAVLVST